MQQKKINQSFKMLLKNKSISPYDLAKELDIKPQSVYRYIWGEREPNARTMLKLMKILNVSAETILTIFAEQEEVKK